MVIRIVLEVLEYRGPVHVVVEEGLLALGLEQEQVEIP
jgi:hypothetical protein